jgi:hypothetical protein
MPSVALAKEGWTSLYYFVGASFEWLAPKARSRSKQEVDDCILKIPLPKSSMQFSGLNLASWRFLLFVLVVLYAIYSFAVGHGPIDFLRNFF